MKRYFVIGSTLNKALIKYPKADDGNVIILHNPLSLDSSILEYKIIMGYLGNNLNREQTITEKNYLFWLKRMYPDLLKYRDFSVAIKFTNKEKDKFIEYMKEVQNKKQVNLSNIYRIYKFGK